MKNTSVLSVFTVSVSVSLCFSPCVSVLLSVAVSFIPVNSVVMHQLIRFVARCVSPLVSSVLLHLVPLCFSLFSMCASSSSLSFYAFLSFSLSVEMCFLCFPRFTCATVSFCTAACLPMIPSKYGPRVSLGIFLVMLLWISLSLFLFLSLSLRLSLCASVSVSLLGAFSRFGFVAAPTCSAPSLLHSQ